MTIKFLGQFCVFLMLLLLFGCAENSQSVKPMASVSATVCGEFIALDTNYRTVFKSDGSAQEFNAEGFIWSIQQHFRDGNNLYLRNLEEDSYANKAYILNADGKTLTPKESGWEKPANAKLAYSCSPQPNLKRLALKICEEGKAAQCCAAGDSDACVEDARKNDDTAKLQQLCQERPDACLALIDDYESDPKPSSPEDFSKALGQFNMYAEKKPLSSEQRNEIADACQRWQTPKLCSKANSYLWLGGQYTEARDLLKQRCDKKLDDQACKLHQQMSALVFPTKIIPATTLPCGFYESSGNALFSEMDFQDKGLVGAIGFADKRRARIEDGHIKIRHDKGGDFVMAQLDENTLIGLDEWTQYNVYTRKNAPTKTCAASVSYHEAPLSEGCGLDKKPIDCCKAGDTQGCNRLGNEAALNNKWDEAGNYYAKVCTAGVRVGCENWIHTVGETGNIDKVENGLKKLCEQDAHHVACDVLESGNLGQMSLIHEMNSVLKNTSPEGAK